MNNGYGCVPGMFFELSCEKMLKFGEMGWLYSYWT